MQEQITSPEQRDEGFTLIELLIAIVVVGILTAVAIVGIRGLTDSGESAACNATRDAAEAALAVYAANENGAAPTELRVLTVTTPNPALVLTGSAIIGDAGTPAANVITGNGWALTWTPGTGAFTGCPAA